MKDNRTSVKRSLFVSAIALTLTAALLIGSTFAWFTSTAQTSVSTIEAGTLGVKLVDSDGKDLKDDTLTWNVADGGTNQAIWEPNASYDLKTFYIENTGNLALKCKMDVTGATGDTKLLEVLDFTYKIGDSEYTLGDEIRLEGKKKSAPIVITAKMRDSADNKYQGLTISGVQISVVATQDTVEYDSKDNQYDKDAPYPVIPVVATADELKNSLTLDAIPVDKDTGNHVPVEVTLGQTNAEQINYSEHATGYTGKGVMLGSTNLNKYGAAPAKEGEYSFIFKDGTITSAATGYSSIDGYKDASVYMLVPGNSDVVFENMTFNGVVSFDIQKYTSPWSNLNSISFKNCTFNGIIIGTCPASNVTFDGCTFNAYTNTASANNSNPIWWREDTEGSGTNANPIETFTFVNNKVTGTRPVKIERIGKTVSPIFTIKNNSFDISKQAGDTATKNMAINIGMGEKPNLPFTLIDEGNTISANTAALYTASLTGGSNQYKETSGMKVLDGNGNNKVITALVWKTTTGETFELKTVD